MVGSSSQYRGGSTERAWTVYLLDGADHGLRKLNSFCLSDNITHNYANKINVEKTDAAGNHNYQRSNQPFSADKVSRVTQW